MNLAETSSNFFQTKKSLKNKADDDMIVTSL